MIRGRNQEVARGQERESPGAEPWWGSGSETPEAVDKWMLTPIQNIPILNSTQ